MAQQNGSLVLGRIGRGGGGGSSLLLLRSTSCQDVDTIPPQHHHQAKNLIPGQMCCSGAQAWEPICVCVAVSDDVCWEAELFSGEFGVVAVLSEAHPSSAVLEMLHQSKKLSRVCGDAASVSGVAGPLGSEEASISTQGAAEAVSVHAQERR